VQILVLENRDIILCGALNWEWRNGTGNSRDVDSLRFASPEGFESLSVGVEMIFATHTDPLKCLFYKVDDFTERTDNANVSLFFW
jgi:hypothetical protein